MDDGSLYDTLALHASFLGYAKVSLECLDFDHEQSSWHRALDEPNIRRLIQVFEIEGCRRYDETHYVCATIVESDFENIGHLQNVSPNNVPQQSTRPLQTGHIKCLHGLHRISAAKRHLDENDQWWIVKLFKEDLSLSSKLSLLEFSANEGQVSDGEIFRKIRLYHHDSKKELENRWWARLSHTKRKELQQLLRNECFAGAFDSLLPWPGLWKPLYIGALHRLLTLKCEEEIVRYLNNIRQTWENITAPLSMDDRSLVDSDTAWHLQALAPSSSESDKSRARQLMKSSEVFSGVPDVNIRQALLDRILEITGSIPTLYTFFEGLKCVEPICKVLRLLLPLKERKSIAEAFSARYYEPAEILIEHAEGDYRSISVASSPLKRSLAYWQLWLFALRHFPDLTQFTPRKELKRDKPIIKEPSPAILQRLAEFAVSLGFKTKPALRLQSGSKMEERMATSLLEQYGRDPQDCRTDITNIADILRALRKRRAAPCAKAFLGDELLFTERRLGRPFERDHLENKSSLYLPTIAVKLPLRGYDITSLYAIADTLSKFLGWHEFDMPDFGAVPDPMDSDGSHASSPPAAERSDHHCEFEVTSTMLAGERDKLLDQLNVVRSEYQETTRRLEADLARTLEEVDSLRTLQHPALREREALLQDLTQSQQTIDALQVRIRELESQINEQSNEARTESSRKDFEYQQECHRMELVAEGYVQQERQRIERTAERYIFDLIAETHRQDTVIQYQAKLLEHGMRALADQIEEVFVTPREVPRSKQPMSLILYTKFKDGVMLVQRDFDHSYINQMLRQCSTDHNEDALCIHTRDFKMISSRDADFLYKSWTACRTLFFGRQSVMMELARAAGRYEDEHRATARNVAPSGRKRRRDDRSASPQRPYRSNSHRRSLLASSLRDVPNRADEDEVMRDTRS